MARWEPEGGGGRARGRSTVDGWEKQMLTRRGARCAIPQREKRRCPPTRSERQLPADVQAFLDATDAGTRELRALQHFALAGHRPHPTCQICQTAIRARLVPDDGEENFVPSETDDAANAMLDLFATEPGAIEAVY